MMDHLASTIKMCELLLPRPREVLIHPESEQASIDDPMPWESVATHRTDELHEPWPQLRPPRAIRSNDIEEASNLIATHCLHREQRVDELTGFHVGVRWHPPDVPAVRIEIRVDALDEKARADPVSGNVHC